MARTAKEDSAAILERKAKAAEQTWRARLPPEQRATVPAPVVHDEGEAAARQTDESKRDTANLERVRWQSRKHARAKSTPKGFVDVPVHLGADNMLRSPDAEHPATGVKVCRRMMDWVVDSDGNRVATLRQDLMVEPAVDAQLRRAREAYTAVLATLWQAALIDEMVKALQDRATRDRNEKTSTIEKAALKASEARDVLNRMRCEVYRNAPPSTVPDWLTVKEVVWLLDHFTPMSHGHGSYSAEGVRDLLDNPAKLKSAMAGKRKPAKKFAPK